MGRNGLSAEAAIDNLERRCAEATHRLGRGLVNDVMKSHPWAIEHLVKKCEALELIQKASDGKTRVVVPAAGGSGVPLSKQAAAVKQRKGKLDVPAEGSACGPASPVEDGDTVPTKYWTVTSLSGAAMCEQLLSKIEPVTLSVHNLRAINLKGKAMENHMHQQRTFEFMTGMSGEFGITGVYRKWSELLKAAKERNTARGRRARDMSLPIDFSKDGLYSMGEVPGGKAKVKHNYTLESLVFSAGALPPHTCFGDLFISSNWSETLAAISSRSDVGNKSDVNLLVHFPQQEVAPVARATGLTLKAIEDGSVVDNPSAREPVDATPPPKKRIRAKTDDVGSFISGLASAAKAARK